MSDDMDRYIDVANQMQQSMAEAQDTLQKATYTGMAGEVSITLNGKHMAETVSIGQATQQGELKDLESAVLDAFNDAIAQVELATREQIAQLAKSLNMPTLEQDD